MKAIDCPECNSRGGIEEDNGLYAPSEWVPCVECQGMGSISNFFNELVTERGFSYFEFVDYYQKKCSIQKSSLATEDAIWLGVNDAEPSMLVSQVIDGGTGWFKFPLPDGVEFNTRMHLTREQVENLIPILQRFVDSGEIQDMEDSE